MRAFAELSENQNSIELRFPYDPGAVVAAKKVGGGVFVPKDKGGPLWRFPLTMQTGRNLRREFGPGLELGIGIKAWGLQERERERNLGAVAKLDDFPIEQMHLHKVHPKLAEYLRPYQRADVAMMALTNVLNGNDMGLGKTVEVIAAICEADLLNAGPHLVVAPKTSLDGVWRIELEKWLGLPVVTWSGELSQEDRAYWKAEMSGWVEQGKPFFLVLGPDSVRRGMPVDVAEWATVTIDEFHKNGLTDASGAPNKGSKFAQAMRKIKAKRKWALSGTPMGGKPIKLWGVLHWLEPKEFSSKWHWANEWLDITENAGGHKEIGSLRPEKQDGFYGAHAKHLVRRLKREVMPWLPAKIYADVWCDMSAVQAKQYKQFEADAEIRIEEERLNAIGILAEYTRLKQFANATCRLDRVRDKLEVLPTPDSGKLGPLWERLDEQGIRPKDAVAGELALVGSESARMVLMVAEWLKGQKLDVEVITGATSQADRGRIQQRCRQLETRPQVIVMTTTAGGMSINLQEANSVHILDETWVPDDQSQLEDRADRGSRETPLLVFYYRSKGTIQERIWKVVGDKAVKNKDILDIRRRMFREGDKYDA